MTTPPARSQPITAKNAPVAPDDWVGHYGDYLYNFAVGQVRDRTLAEDLVQDTFLAALKARERFAGTSSERTWLVGILRHKIIDQLRHRQRWQTVALEGTDSNRDRDDWGETMVWLHEVAADCQEPHRRMELAEFRDSLRLALGKLPPRIAQAFEMYEINDCSGREVCETVQISEQNLWVMLHRARKQLRTELASWWSHRSESARDESRN
jgi:RNA polymerase sigma-70 factor (ECF subfamily)